MKKVRFLCMILALFLLLGIFPMCAYKVSAAATQLFYADVTNGKEYTSLTLYKAASGRVTRTADYSATNQTGKTMAQDGFLDKNNAPSVTWTVQAEEAGWYTFDPYYYISHFGAMKNGVYNMVWCVNDTRYYLGKDITRETDSNYNGYATLKVLHGMDVIQLYLDQGVNIVRMLPLAGPNYEYQKVDRGDGVVTFSYVDIYKVYIDDRLTVRETAPLSLNVLTAGQEPSYKYGLTVIDSGTEKACYQSVSSYIETAQSEKINYETLCAENVGRIPYISYTLNAPADGWYDMTLDISTASAGVYGNDGYMVVRVNGTNYKRYYHGNETFSNQNISVPLKAGDNAVTITCVMGMKGGSDGWETQNEGYARATRFRSLTVYGGVTLSTNKIDPTTVPDAPKPSTKLEAETYATGWNYTASGTKMVSGDLSGVTGLPTLRSLWEGDWFDKAAVPHVSFTVDVPTAGTYTVKPVYTLKPASGANALKYYITGSANDSFYDKARFEPLTALSRTDGYSELTLELEAGVNVIRLMPVLDGDPAGALDIDYIQITGDSAVTGIAPQQTQLQSAQAEYKNKLTVSGDVLTGTTGTVTECGKLNAGNMDDTGWFAYTVNVPKDGYYDLHVFAGGGAEGSGSLALILDGQVFAARAELGRTAGENPVNLSRYLTAGEHTLMVTGLLGQEGTLGALTVSGGITVSAIQTDPWTLGVVPLVKEGGLVPGSVYTEKNCIITSVPKNTTLKQFKSNFRGNEQAIFTDASGNTLEDGDIITVGCQAQYPNETCYVVREVLTQDGARSVGADVLLELCNPVGRLLKYKDSLFMESSASNFTLTGQMEGDVSLTLTVEMKKYDLHSLFVEVDGTMSYFELANGLQTLVIAEDLEAGSHTIKVSKGTEAYRQDMYIHSVTYTGSLGAAQAAGHRIEFLGDSITAGSGVFFEDCGFGQTHSYFSYANMTADALGADYYSVANGGWRFTSTYKPETAIGTIYPYTSMHEDLGENDFTSWKPDVIVINLGTNDTIGQRSDTTNYTQESFTENITILLDLVRAKNPNAEILWAYGMMTGDMAVDLDTTEWIQSAVEAYSETDPKVHYVYCKPNTLGRGNHPNFEGSTENAEILVKAICEIMGWEVPTGTHATGDCGGAASCEFCRHNELTLALHTYDDMCDAACNNADCNHKRTAPHYSTDCTKTTCDLCSAAKKASASHSYGKACDEYCDNPDCANRRNGAAHSFEEDACAVCGIQRIEPDFTGASVTMYNDLSLNFKVDATRLFNHGYEDAYAVFTCNGHSVTVNEGVQTGDTLAFTFPGIAPQRLGDTVTATLYTTLDGETVTQTAEYSVADYCYNMLEKCTGDEYQELRTLLVDMLNYGAAAQVFADYKSDALVTADLTEEHLKYATTGTPVLNDIRNTAHTTVSDPQVTWKGAGLYLKDAVVVRLKFSAENTEGLTVTMALGDAKCTLDESDFVSAGGENLYYVYFNQLNAAQMREAFDVTFYRDGNAVSDTLRYSIESYIYSKQGSADANLTALVTALIRYGDAAYAFVN